MGSKKKPQTAKNPSGEEKKNEENKPIIVEEMAHYEHQFTSEESNQLGLDLSNALTQIENLDNDKKSLVSEFNGKIEEQRAIVTKTKNLRMSGRETRQGKCKVIKDFDGGTKKFFLLATGELVKESKIEQSDYTLHFPTEKPISEEEEEELLR